MFGMSDQTLSIWIQFKCNSPVTRFEPRSNQQCITGLVIQPWCRKQHSSRQRRLKFFQHRRLNETRSETVYWLAPSNEETVFLFNGPLSASSMPAHKLKQKNILSPGKVIIYAWWITHRLMKRWLSLQCLWNGQNKLSIYQVAAAFITLLIEMRAESA